MHTLDKDCWYPLWKLMKSQCDILISRASKWCKIMMEKGRLWYHWHNTALLVSRSESTLRRRSESPPASVQGKLRHSALQRCNLHVWDGVQLPQPQPNLTLTDHTSPWSRNGVCHGQEICVCLYVCLHTHRFYREKDPRHNSKQRGNQFNGQLGNQILPWLLGV